MRSTRHAFRDSCRTNSTVPAAPIASSTGAPSRYPPVARSPRISPFDSRPRRGDCPRTSHVRAIQYALRVGPLHLLTLGRTTATGTVSHLAAAGRFEAPYPFHEANGAPID